MYQNNERVTDQARARIEGRAKERAARSAQLDSMRKGKKFDWRQLEEPERLVERARRRGLTDAVGELLRAPEAPEAGNKILEQILGANNLLGINFLFEGSAVARSVGRILLPVSGGTRLGTGFMITSRLMMTNNHVLESRVEAGNAILEFDFFERESGATSPVSRFRLQPAVFFVTDAPLDFSIVAVEPVNAAGAAVSSRGALTLFGPSGKAVVGERLSIIQHPGGDPQKVAVHDNELVDVMPDFLHYEADTMGGSSGSPVLNIDWDVVALHHAAVGSTNEGVRISAVVARLREIFSAESAGDVDSVLLAELLAGQAKSPTELRPSRDGGSDSPPAGIEGPTIGPDGTASWVLPVRVNLGVGGGATPVVTVGGAGGTGAGGGAGPGTTPGTGPDSPLPIIEDPTVDAGLNALQDAEDKEYYDAEADKATAGTYYSDEVSDLSGAALYRYLSKLVTDTHTTTLDYKTARHEHLYPWVDRRSGENRELQGIYSGQVFDALEIIRQEAEMERRRETALRERVLTEAFGGDDEAFWESLESNFPFNCEHVVPQSWFNKKSLPKADLHHLFTCESRCNSFRSNHAFFEFGAEAMRDGCGESQSGKFEPVQGKGAAARATLYFLLRYPKEVAGSSNEMPRSRLETLLAWSAAEPPGLWEKHRNAEIAKVQGNRNPLIDFPELAEKVSFSMGLA